MNVQIDTNILTRLAQHSHPQHANALLAVTNLSSALHSLAIVPQNLFEFWTVATRPTRENGLGLSTAEAQVELTTIKKTFILLPDPPRVVEEWERLIVAYDCKGKPTHDAHLVATMILNGLTKLLTFNVKDFMRYKEISAIDPNAIANGSTVP